jgi:hypothetical protein
VVEGGIHLEGPKGRHVQLSDCHAAPSALNLISRGVDPRPDGRGYFMTALSGLMDMKHHFSGKANSSFSLRLHGVIVEL